MSHGIVIAGTHSGCGKTTVTLGILAALIKKGLKVQAFKVGPDFIDTGLHRFITARSSRNLDLWMCGENYVTGCYTRHSYDAEISIVEGVMGMYDGDFSTALLAKHLDLPIMLVIDAYGMAESAGAIVKGFKDWWNGSITITGIIFNRVASENHYRRLKRSVLDTLVLGYLPRDLHFEIPQRHLGLKVAEEKPISEKNIERLTDTVLQYIDIDRLLSPEKSKVKKLRSCEDRTISTYQPCDLSNSQLHSSSPTIAIAYDRAFCFYYEDNLDQLKAAGAKIVKFSPLYDSVLPDGINALYIGGGYPELYAKELSANVSILQSINHWAEEGNPIYAECGGLMYLSLGLYDFNGSFYKMAGVFPFETQIFTKGDKGGLRPCLGYREISLKEDCILGRKGDRMKGHEFHYSVIKDGAESFGLCETYSVKDNKGEKMKNEGYRFKNTLASYIHIHFGSNRDIPKNVNHFIDNVHIRLIR